VYILEDINLTAVLIELKGEIMCKLRIKSSSRVIKSVRDIT
jgi:hypothetical protein